MKEITNMNCLFVYGTLMHGERASYLLKGYRCFGGYVLKDYAMYDLGAFPGIKKEEGKEVRGEVYWVPDSMIERLDEYEGEGTVHRREMLTVTSGYDEHKAIVYVYLGNVGEKRIEGRWEEKHIRKQNETKAEKLAGLIGVSVEMIEREFDQGILDILIELNSKNYYTIFSCEGHLGEYKGKPDHWNGYLAFADKYSFSTYPPLFYKNSRDRRFFYWEGFGEDSRQEYLNNVLDWAKCLPTREKTKITLYQLVGFHKKRPNTGKTLVYSYDYEDVRVALARSDACNYTNFIFNEHTRYI